MPAVTTPGIRAALCQLPGARPDADPAQSPDCGRVDALSRGCRRPEQPLAHARQRAVRERRVRAVSRATSVRP